MRSRVREPRSGRSPSRSGLLPLGLHASNCHDLDMKARTGFEIEQLSVEDCLTLVGSVTVGRLAISHRAIPAVVPVRVHLVDHEIVVQSLLDEVFPLLGGAVVALEVGTLGDGPTPEWVVEVRGFLSPTADDAVPRSASSGQLRLSADLVMGWRLRPTAFEPPLVSGLRV